MTNEHDRRHISNQTFRYKALEEEKKRMSAAEGSALLQELFGVVESPSKRESDFYEDPLAKILGVRPIDSHKPLLAHE